MYRARWPRNPEALAKVVQVAERDGQVVGFVRSGPYRASYARIEPEPAEGALAIGEINALYVLPEHQRGGIGAALLSTATDILAGRRMDPVTCGCSPTTPRPAGSTSGWASRTTAAASSSRWPTWSAAPEPPTRSPRSATAAPTLSDPLWAATTRYVRGAHVARRCGLSWERRVSRVGEGGGVRRGGEH